MEWMLIIFTEDDARGGINLATIPMANEVACVRARGDILGKKINAFGCNLDAFCLNQETGEIK